MSIDLTGRIALVTGASRGIGYFLSLELAKRGAHVIAVARTVGGLEELDDDIRKLGGSATLVPLDITDMEAIDRLGGSIHERWSKLDVMVANAGVLGTISPIGHVEAKTFEKVMNVNVTSVWRLIRSTDPLLRMRDGPFCFHPAWRTPAGPSGGLTLPRKLPSKSWRAVGPKKRSR